MKVFLNPSQFEPLLVSPLLLGGSTKCKLSIFHRNTIVDLIEFYVVDFDAIVSMDWLHSCYSTLDCRTIKVKFDLPNELPIKWEGSYLAKYGKFISYLRARKSTSKGYFLSFSLS